ncbi:hypothetical protein SRHO_G00215160 [Serrasalmus rhombeus]
MGQSVHGVTKNRESEVSNCEQRSCLEHSGVVPSQHRGEAASSILLQDKKLFRKGRVLGSHLPPFYKQPGALREALEKAHAPLRIRTEQG